MNEVGKTSLNNFNNPFRYILFTDIIIQKRVSSVWIVKTLKKKRIIMSYIQDNVIFAYMDLKQEFFLDNFTFIG